MCWRKGGHVYRCVRLSLLSFSDQTFSLWGHIWDHIDDYINPLHCPGDHDIIEPNTDLRQLRLECTLTPFEPDSLLLCRFWYGLYGRYNLQDRLVEKEEDFMASLWQQNMCLEEHIDFLSQVGLSLTSSHPL